MSKNRKEYMRNYMREYRKKNKGHGITDDIKDAIKVLVELFNKAFLKYSTFADLIGETEKEALKTLQGAIK